MLENDIALKFEYINKRIDNMAKCFLNMQEEITLLKNENAELKKLLNIETKKETTTDNSIEQWFDIDGWEGFYQISNLGNVKSLQREFINRGGGLSKVKEKILKHHYDCGKQMFYVQLTYLGKSEKFYIENLNPKIYNGNVKFKYPNIRYRILQYDLNRRLVHQWNSFKELREQTTYSIERISQCCRDKSKKYNNYYWEKIQLP